MQKLIAGHSRATRTWISGCLLLGTSALVSGCHVDQWRQPKMLPYYESDFFADQQASRPLVPGTVVHGGKDTLRTADPAYFRGYEANNKLTKTIPLRAVQSFASPKDMLLRGQERYGAYCTPCHGKTGDGNGFITQRGLGYWQKLPASYHTKRLNKIEDGHIYDVLTNGYGIMYGYGSRIQDVNDRWAVVAYVRALQLTRTASGAPAEAPTGTPQAGEQPQVNQELEPGNVPLKPNGPNGPGTTPLVPGGVPVERPVNRTPGGVSPEGERRPAPAPSPSPAAAPATGGTTR